MSKPFNTPLMTFQMSFSGNLFQRTPDNPDYDRDALPAELLWLIEQQLPVTLILAYISKKKTRNFSGWQR